MNLTDSALTRNFSKTLLFSQLFSDVKCITMGRSSCSIIVLLADGYAKGNHVWPPRRFIKAFLFSFLISFPWESLLWCMYRATKNPWFFWIQFCLPSSINSFYMCFWTTTSWHDIRRKKFSETVLFLYNQPQEKNQTANDIRDKKRKYALPISSFCLWCHSYVCDK